MALTRAAAEKSAVLGVGAQVLADAGMAATYDGATPNADLNDPLLRALDHLRIQAADPTAVADADLARVPPAATVRFLDYLRLMVTEAALHHVTTKPRYQQWDDYRIDYGEMAKNLTATLDTLWASYRRRYASSSAPEVGKLCREVRDQLDPRRYFPPFRATPVPPFGPIVPE